MKALFLVVCVTFCANMASGADTVLLTPSADTTLFQSSPDNNMGGVFTLAAGMTGHATASRALMKFDMTGQIPANAVVTGARLRLTIVRTPFAPQPTGFTLHRMLKDWAEGNKSFTTLGAPADAGETTWNNRIHPSTPWQAPGGTADVDFSSVVSSSSPNSAIGTSLFETSPEMVADVQNWMANPNQNFGWMVIASNEGTSFTARRFGSREDANNSPVLEIEYAPPFRIDNVGLVNSTFHLSFPVEPLFTYTVEARSSLSSGSWGPVTNFTETLSSYEATISEAPAGPSRFYRVLKAPCNCQ